jgi:hypothetical protein
MRRSMAYRLFTNHIKVNTALSESESESDLNPAPGCDSNLESDS